MTSSGKGWRFRLLNLSGTHRPRLPLTQIVAQRGCQSFCLFFILVRHKGSLVGQTLTGPALLSIGPPLPFGWIKLP